MLDGVSGLLHIGVSAQVTMAVIREIAMLKSRGITAVLTTLIGPEGAEASGLLVSSLVDTWLLLRNVETNGEHNRLLFVRKSRGSAHSNQMREFVLTDQGVELLDVYLGPEGPLTGKARIAREAADRAAARDRAQAVKRRRRKLREHAAQVEAQVRSYAGSWPTRPRRSSGWRPNSPARTRRWPAIASRWRSTAGPTPRRLPPPRRGARGECAEAE